MDQNLDELWLVKWSRIEQCSWLGTVREARRIGQSQYDGGGDLRRQWEMIASNGRRWGELFSYAFVGFAETMDRATMSMTRLHEAKRLRPRETFPELCAHPLIEGPVLEKALRQAEEKGGPHSARRGALLLNLCGLLRDAVPDPEHFVAALAYPNCDPGLNEGDTFLRWSLDPHGELECHYRDALGDHCGWSRHVVRLENEDSPALADADLHVVIWNPFTDELSVWSPRALYDQAYTDFLKWDAEDSPGQAHPDHPEMNRTFIDVFRTAEEARDLVERLRSDGR